MAEDLIEIEEETRERDFIVHAVPFGSVTLIDHPIKAKSLDDATILATVEVSPWGKIYGVMDVERRRYYDAIEGTTDDC